MAQERYRLPSKSIQTLKFASIDVLPDKAGAKQHPVGTTLFVLQDEDSGVLVYRVAVCYPGTVHNPVFDSVSIEELERAVLGTTDGMSGPSENDFEPVEIRGESLSATILRERR
jgi:hypothetical protein